MIEFNPADPFPLLDLDKYTYHEAQEHSALVDQWLGFHLAEIENKISSANGKNSAQQNWQHLSVQAFQTPYVELRNILEILKSYSPRHIVDLGCAYARMAFVMARHYPEMTFTGYELESLRVDEANRVLSLLGHSNVNVIAADLSSTNFRLPAADVYFIFDYGSETAVKKTLEDLKKIAQNQSIIVVARGRLSRFLIHKEHPWLAEVHTPQHYPHFSLYFS